MVGAEPDGGDPETDGGVTVGEETMGGVTLGGVTVGGVILGGVTVGGVIVALATWRASFTPTTPGVLRTIFSICCRA